MNTQDRYNSAFATRLRGLIERNHVTITALAESVGISRQAMSQYTYGGGQPAVDKLKKICDYFGVSADYLLGLDEYMYREHFDVTAEQMGLSEEAVDILQKAYSQGKAKIAKMVSLMVECESFLPFALAMENYLEEVKLMVRQSEAGPNNPIHLLDLVSDDDVQIRRYILNDVFSKMLDQITTTYNQK